VDFAPDLVEVVPRHRHNSSTVSTALLAHAWIRDVVGVLIVPTLVQYLELRRRLENRAVQEGVTDRFVWKWCSSGSYSASSAYIGLLAGQSTVLGVRELWKAKAPNNVWFFGCLAIHGRCWTGDRYFRHGLQDSDKCAPCSQGVETLDGEQA
jgi:hypothetical protein